MSIEFTWLDEIVSVEKVSMSGADLEALDGVFLAMKDKTGLEIDPYADTRLSPDHALFLRELVDSYPSGSDGFKRLASMLMKSKKYGRWILVVGD